MQDCIFCKIVNKRVPANVVFENEKVIAFNSIAPVSEIHVLVVPKEHISTFLELNNVEITTELTKAIQELVTKLNIKDGYKLVVNGGKYQAVKHLHYHLLGGKFEDENDVLNKT